MSKRRDHHFTERICHWLYCRHCGLVALKNEATRKAMKRPCPGLEEEVQPHIRIK